MEQAPEAVLDNFRLEPESLTSKNSVSGLWKQSFKF